MTAAFLQPELRRRVVGNTLGSRPRLGELRRRQRTWVILRHAWGLDLRKWLAVDDNAYGVPAEYEHHFLHTTSEFGQRPCSTHVSFKYELESVGAAAVFEHAWTRERCTDKDGRVEEKNLNG